MRISDWSSDVCSSDLEQGRQRVLQRALNHPLQRSRPVDRIVAGLRQPGEGGVVQLDGDLAIRQQPAQPPELDVDDAPHLVAAEPVEDQIGSASCRESVCQYVSISGAAGPLKKKKKH